ncbi:MAG TPA: glycosyltransferase family 2 protein [Bacteroidia bacterium]
MQQLSAVIITFNEEKNIGRCLESIKDIADDIVVVDSFSTDKTSEICSKHSANFIQHTWEGYSATKNFANAQAKYDWVLSLDADEALSPQLQDSIRKLKSGNNIAFCTFNRLTNYCGTWINHCGWYPDTKLRLFDRRKTKWDGLIHEKLIFSEKIHAQHLKGDCLHYSYYTTEDHYKQLEKFTDLSAKHMFDSNTHPNFISFYLSPAVKFFQCYFLKLGFLDGAAGFSISCISAYGVYLKYHKLKKLLQAK